MMEEKAGAANSAKVLTHEARQKGKPLPQETNDELGIKAFVFYLENVRRAVYGDDG